MGSMNPPRRHIRRVLLATASLALLLPGTAGVAEDVDLFSNRVSPNVMIVVDTSGSMTNVVWHPAYRPDVIYDPDNCPYTPNPTTDDEAKCLKHPLCDEVQYGDDGLDAISNVSWQDVDNTLETLHTIDSYTFCENEREIYVDPLLEDGSKKTRWQIKYLQWYFSDNVEEDPDGDSTTILDEILAHDNGDTSPCVLAADASKPAHYDKYRRSRVTAGKEILREVICETNAIAPIRYGLAKFKSGSDPEGGYVRVPIDDYTDAHANDLENKINELTGSGWTPLSETLYNVYRYFQSRGTDEQAWGKNGPGTTRFDKYNLSTSGYNTSSPPPSPLEYDCQQNFIILITDGEPTRDDFDGMNLSKFQNDLIGDYYDPGDEVELPPNIAFAPVITGDSCDGDGSDTEDSCEVDRYLDDITYFMHENDFQLDPDFPSKQVIETYTVGFTTSPKANDLLDRAAQRGNGEFFFSNNAEELTDALTKAIGAIVSKSRSFTAATVPASRTTDGNNFYTSYFIPREGTAFWEGHLKDFDFSSLGDVLTADGFCATGDDEDAVPSPTCPSGGRLRTYAPAFWDAATAIPDPDDRNLFVEFASTPMFHQPTVWSTGTVSYADLWILNGIDENQEPYLSAGLTDETEIARAVIDVARGCEFNSVPCVPRLNDAGDKIYLGDIYHSNPIVVGSPNSPINEAAYHEFAIDKRTRTRVIYAGGNDGWVHGFNAGNWQTQVLDADGNPTGEDLIPPRHDRGTGEELFGYMPYPVRNRIKNLPKLRDAIRQYETVDGSPIAADAWFYRDVSGDDLTTVNPTLTLANKQEEQWRTVLIGGLRNGGRGYYGLDVSDPTAAASDVSSDYPRYLWGFPCQSFTDLCTGGNHFPIESPGRSYDSYMGYSWSEPVITRVRVAVDGGDPRGHERWVAIFGAGYYPTSDPNAGTNSSGNPIYRVDSYYGRAIFMVDITTGGVLAMKYFHATDEYIDGAQIGYKEMKYAFASAPAVFDLNFDGFADVIYIGDIGGNVWKWVVNRIGDDPINNSSGSPDANFAQPDWPFRLFFTGSPSANPPERQDPPGAYNPSIHYQSFFFPPTGVLRNNKLILAFGAGERADPIGPSSRYDDGSLIDNNHYYVVKDSDPLARNPSAPDPITDAVTEGDLADFDDPTPLECGEMKATKQGYYITARDAEKFVTNSVVFLGTVYTGSFIPPDPDSDDPCDASGDSYVYAFDLECGLGEFTDEPGGPADKRRKAIGDGMPTRPRVSVGDLNQPPGPGPCKNKVVIITSDGDISNDCGGDFDTQGINIRSWRER